MTFPNSDANPGEEETMISPEMDDVSGHAELPQLLDPKVPSAHRAQVGTTLEEAFHLSTKGKW